MKNLFKQAHKMAKEIKSQYPEVDYKIQFALCLKHLQTAKEESNTKIYGLDNKVTTIVTSNGTEFKFTRHENATDYQVTFSKSFAIKDTLKAMGFRFSFGSWVKHYQDINEAAKDIEAVSVNTNYNFNYATGVKK